MNIGAHVPMHHSARSAEQLDADVVQICLGSPRTWNTTAMPKGAIADRLFVHAPYLVNLSAVKPDLYQKSLDSLGAQGAMCLKVQSKGLVFHGGSYKGGDKLQALQQWRDAVMWWPLEWCPLYVENAAGGKCSLTRDLYDLEMLWKDIQPSNIRFCLDTAHLWANMAKPGDARAYIDDVIGIVGNIDLVHANGSKAAMGSGRDVHSPLASSVAPAQWVADCVMQCNPTDVIIESSDPGPDIEVLRELVD